ncbi:MAG: DNA repair protein RecN, partial [Syntrophomonadaceae bacterium]|nr:DNA repair protein RecN [Syntrophomonadaceae bacterium]
VGDRLKPDLIRDDEKKAVVEAVFDISNRDEIRLFLNENGLNDDEEEILIITREILPNGRSLARINGRTINIGTLRELTEFLLDMHLQHDHLTILKKDNYLDYVDSFSKDIEDLLIKINNLYIQIKETGNQLEELKANENNKLQRIDYLNYQINEIKKANLVPGEEEELTALVSRVRNAEHLATIATKVLEALYSGENGFSAYDQIASAIDAINETDEEFFQPFLSSLEDMYYNIQDIAGEVSRFRDSLDFEPNLLDEIESRLFVISKLKSKYGDSIKEILEYCQKAQDELEMLENSSSKQSELENLLVALNKEYNEVAHELTQKRKAAAEILEKTVNEELRQLNMPNLKFAVAVEPVDKPTPKGLDDIEFLFSPNPGEPLKPLSKIASGGEISRFILALKSALTEVYNVPTFIFDEIDVGVGGTSLSAMAKKLRELAKNHQVILVTHSPQVASYANTHFLIEKYIKNNQTFTTVKELSYSEKIKELARMLGGDNYSEITLKHAGEMLDKAILG